MATLTFFMNRSNKNDAKKDLTHLLYGSNNIVNADLKYPCDSLEPIFELGSAKFDFSKCNYLYWAETKRYYTIENAELMNHGIVRLHCKVDPFYSFITQIRGIKTIIERQEKISNCNPHIPDELVVGRIDRQIVKTNVGMVGGGSHGNHICLTTTGGEQ